MEKNWGDTPSATLKLPWNVYNFIIIVVTYADVTAFRNNCLIPVLLRCSLFKKNLFLIFLV